MMPFVAISYKTTTPATFSLLMESFIWSIFSSERVFISKSIQFGISARSAREISSKCWYEPTILNLNLSESVFPRGFRTTGIKRRFY